ncbi:MAG: phage major capsid protein [Polyangia bacterium]|jgi:hypothetical protein|nr:phage major capsid protein [Polyangia bacterium]
MQTQTKDDVRHKDEPRADTGIKAVITEALGPMKADMDGIKAAVAPLPAMIDAAKAEAADAAKKSDAAIASVGEKVAHQAQRLDGVEAALQAPGRGVAGAKSIGEIVHESDAYKRLWSKGEFGQATSHKARIPSLLFGADGRRLHGEKALLGSAELAAYAQPVYRAGIVSSARGVFGLPARIPYVPMPGAETYVVRKETPASVHGYVKTLTNGAIDGSPTPKTYCDVDSTTGFVAGTYVRFLNPTTGALVARKKIVTVTSTTRLTFATDDLDFDLADDGIVVGENYGATAESTAATSYTKPYGHLAVTSTNEALKTLAILYAITEARLKSAPGLTAFLQSKMQILARENLSWHLLYGNDSDAGQLAGFASETGAQTYAWSTGGDVDDNRLDAVIRAASMINGAGELSVVMCKSDFFRLLLLKGSDGHYLGSAKFGKIPMERIDGSWYLLDMPIVIDDACRVADFFVVDFARASELVDQQSDALGFGYVASQFANNEITARYEHSVLHAILDPGAYVYGQWDEAPSAV